MDIKCKVCSQPMAGSGVDGCLAKEGLYPGASWVLVCPDCSKTLSPDAPPVSKLLMILGRLFKRGE